MEQEFIAAIHNKKKLEITYYAQKHDAYVTRVCAPMDIGPHQRYPEKGDYYHVWDYDGSKGPHPAPLSKESIKSITVLDESFDPADFVTWNTNWTVSRDWGAYS